MPCVGNGPRLRVRAPAIFTPRVAQALAVYSFQAAKGVVLIGAVATPTSGNDARGAPRSLRPASYIDPACQA